MSDESDVDEERKTRSDRLSRRFESNDKATPKRSSSSNTSTTSKASKTSKTVATDTDTQTDSTSQKSKTDKTPVKDRETVMMYLPDDVKRNLNATFSELEARREREGKSSIQKNRDYFPAVIEVALDHVDEIEEHLGEED